MVTKIRQRRGTAAQWTTANTLLGAGELGVETDTGKVKVGNGSALWNALPYLTGAASTTEPIDGGTPSSTYDGTTLDGGTP